MTERLHQDKRLLLLAAPMILANITTPLLGMVDTAVLGHLPSVEALAGASIGALVITQIYWVCGFLRMSITGLSAQQKGAKSHSAPDYAKPYEAKLYNCLFREGSGMDLCQNHFNDMVRSIYRSGESELNDKN